MWLNPPAGKMKWIVCSDHDWLLMWARWALPSRSGFPALVPQKSYFNGHIINPLLTKTTRYSPFIFCLFIVLDFVTVHKYAKKNLANVSSRVYLTIGLYEDNWSHRLRVPSKWEWKKREIAIIANTRKRCCEWKNILYKQCLLLATNISHCLLSSSG